MTALQNARHAIRTLVFVLLVTGIPQLAQAQIRRTSPPSGAGASAPVGKATSRMPFAGSWEGKMVLKDGPGTGEPIVMRFDVKEVTNGYRGITIHPGHGQAPHENTRVVDGIMQWEQPNSGGGTWYYTARLTNPDRLTITLILRDWPQGGGSTPNGSFVLTRRPDRAGAPSP